MEKANTGVADVLFLGLKSYECTVHQLFRGKTDHGRIIQRNKTRFLYSVGAEVYKTLPPVRTKTEPIFHLAKSVN